MAEEYEEGWHQRKEENRKRLEVLNLPLLSQALHNSSFSKITSPLPKRMKSSTIEEQTLEVRRSSRVANMSLLVYDEPHTSDACPSASTAPTNSQSSNPTSSQSVHTKGSSRATRHPGRKSSHYWWVDVIDESEIITKRQMTVKDMTNFGNKLRIVVDFDDFGSPTGEATGLLAGVLWANG